MVQSRNLASGAGEKLRREHVPTAAGARWGEGQPSGTQDYDDPAKLAVVRLGRRCRGIEQSVRSPMKLRSFSCEWRGTSSPFFKYTCAIIIRLPVTRRRVILPQQLRVPGFRHALVARCRLLGASVLPPIGTVQLRAWRPSRARAPRSSEIYGPPKRLNHQAKCIRHDHALRHADRDLIPTLE